MSNLRVSTVWLLLAALLILAISCSNSTGPDNSHKFPDPVDAVATDITLYVYSDGLGIVLDTLEMDIEGTITIDIEEENPYYDPPQYYIYALADGFYTELYDCQKGGEIAVDLDGVPQVDNSLTGVIFAQQTFFADCYFANQQIALSIPGGNSIITTTDEQGRFGLGNLTEGSYVLHFSEGGLPHSYEILMTSQTNYRDLYFTEAMVVEAPNIYLYPKTTMSLNVTVDFPGGGQIIESEPPYNDGWEISVTPEGIIDGQYNYLFYEVLQAIPLKTESGWLLDGSNLESEFRYLLMNLGFVGREVDDFIAYWLPRLGEWPWYAVYPQDVETMINLNIEPKPDNVMRTIFLIRPSSRPMPMTPLPLPDVVKRDGFTVVEWGAILLK